MYENKLFSDVETNINTIKNNQGKYSDDEYKLILSFINKISSIDKDRTSFYLTLVICLIIILIHINFYINPNLRPSINIISVDEKATYIAQNYIYFAIMYWILIIKKFINKPDKIINLQ